MARTNSDRAAGAVGIADRLRHGLQAEASRVAIALALLPWLGAADAQAASPPVLPQGGTFAAGTGSIAQSGSQLTVNQATQRSVINWQSFSIGADGKVQINNGNGATLNRVTGGNLSSIMGELRATGTVYLLNPQGVVVGAGGSVVTGGSFVASTLDLNDQSFMAGGSQTFKGNSTAAVRNDGSIRSAGGDVVLIARSVTNTGSIAAPQGTAALAAGSEVLLREADGNERVFVKAPGGDVTNSGAIAAAQAELKAAGGNIYALAGNNGGAVRATGTATVDGHVWLTADGGGIENSGAISAVNANGNGGTVTLAAAQLTNSGSIAADGAALNPVMPTPPDGAGQNLNNVLPPSATTRAPGGKGGTVSITVAGGLLSNTGSVSASGATGGRLAIAADRILQQGKLAAEGSAGAGGEIAVNFSAAYVDTEGAASSVRGSGAAGGSIALTGQAGSNLFASGSFDATGETGGSVHLLASTIDLMAAGIDASGRSAGGAVRIGGDFHGGGDLPQADAVRVNKTTTIRVDATLSGDGGSAVVWSTQQTQFFGTSSARGAGGGRGGQREVSSKGDLVYGGQEGGSSGAPGSLLLDPANIVIDSTGGDFAKGDLVDPDPHAGNHFGASVVSLSGGNIAVTSPFDNLGGTHAGAAYLFNGSTGALISTITGSQANDEVGVSGITALVGNGNFVVASNNWHQTAANAGNGFGAATYGNGVTGFSGAQVSSANSLVGTQAFDLVSNEAVTALANGNYVVISSVWHNLGAGQLIRALGAVTFGNGLTGVSGNVSSGNSLVGQNQGVSGGAAGDQLGSGGVVALTNGNFVISSPGWNDFRGAATWVNGSSGLTGTVTASNSLIGTVSLASNFIGDQLGRVVVPLSNGNYVVASDEFAGGVGAVFLGNGTTGTVGTAALANSWHGTATTDHVGDEVVALPSGKYVILSTVWNGGFGAVTLVDQGTPTGTVGAGNSLVGSAASDNVGGGQGSITVLTNGNYVVWDPQWGGGPQNGLGAATFINIASPTVGVINSTNSLIGSTGGNTSPPAAGGDFVGSGGFEAGQSQTKGVVALTNGNYVVVSPFWDNTLNGIYAGAVTFGSGTAGVHGTISSANSLVGTHTQDLVGSGGVIPLAGGGYVVASPNWTNGATYAAGAVTVAPATGVTGTISAANSLVGTATNDQVGGGSSGGIPQCSGTCTGASAVPPFNPVGTRVNGLFALPNGNYVVVSPFWNNGASSQVGAVTFGNGSTGVIGAVTTANSLIGSTAGDQVGSGGVSTRSNGDYAVLSPSWHNGALANAGAVTLGRGTGGTVGTVTASNSLFGSVANAGLNFANFIGTGPNAGALVASFTTDTGFNTAGVVGNGRVTIAIDDPNLLTFGALPGQTVTITPAFITATTNAGTNVIMQATNDITVNSPVAITPNGGVPTPGDLTLQANHDIIINAGGSISSAGGDIQLVDGHAFTNNKGASALSATAGGRWLVWSQSPLTDTRGGLVYSFKQYGATFGTTTPAQATGNGFLYTLAPSITPLLVGSTSKTYDGTTAATLTAVNYSSTGAIDGDTVTVNGSTSGTYNNKNAGTGKTVTGTGVAITSATNGAATVFGYTLASTSASGTIGTITPKDITASLTGPVSKVYDSTTVATLNPGSVSFTGLITGDVVSAANSTGSYDTKNVGTGKLVSVAGLSLTGTDAGNYHLTTTSLSANVGRITAATLTAGLTGTVSKTYDANTTATLAAGNYTLGSVFAGDVVTLNNPTTGSYDTKNAGTGKTVSVSGLAISGTDAGNYVLASTTASGAVGTITAKDVTATLTGTVSKTYNSTTAAPFTSANFLLSGTIGGDAVSVAGTTGTYDTKNVGTGKTVSVSGLTLSGGDAGNYHLTGTTASDTIGTITAATLTAGLTGTVSKTYDGTTTATLAGGNYTLGGVFLGDTVALNNPTTGSYDTKNAGTNKTVSVAGLAISGTDAGNYVLASATASGTIGTITAKDITASLIGTVSKVYDATTTATVAGGNFLLSGTIGGDTVSLAGATGTYDTRNVGTGKTVTASALTLGGGDAGNYHLTTVTASGAIGTITARPLTLAAVTDTKIYDGGVASALAPTVAPAGTGTGLAGTDGVTGLTQTFDSRNAGARTLSVNGFTINDGNGGNNYAVTLQTAAGTITQRALTVSAVGDTKVYDGTVSSAAVPVVAAPTSTSGLVAGDTTSTAVEVFDSRNAGPRTLSVSGLTVNDGNGGNNYAVTLQTAAGSITPKTLTAILTGVTKTYDGTIAAVLAGSNLLLTGAIGGDAVSIGPVTGTYDTKNAGTGKTVTVSGLTLAGGDAGNYTLSATTAATANGIINPAPLTVAADDAAIKAGQPLPPFSASFTGFVAGEGPGVLGGSLQFATTATAASPPGLFPITPFGLTAQNYLISFVPGTLQISGTTLVLPVLPASDFVLPPSYGSTTYNPSSLSFIAPSANAAANPPPNGAGLGGPSPDTSPWIFFDSSLSP